MNDGKGLQFILKATQLKRRWHSGCFTKLRVSIPPPAGSNCINSHLDVAGQKANGVKQSLYGVYGLNSSDCRDISEPWESVAKIGLRGHALKGVRVGSAILR